MQQDRKDALDRGEGSELDRPNPEHECRHDREGDTNPAVEGMHTRARDPIEPLRGVVDLVKAPEQRHAVQEAMRPIHRELDPEDRPHRLNAEGPSRDDDVEARQRSRDDEPDDHRHDRSGRRQRGREQQVHDIGAQAGPAHWLIVTAEHPFQRRQQREAEQHGARGFVADPSGNEQCGREHGGAHDATGA